MNYGELKTAVLAYAHRPDLTDEVAGFVRLAEGKIRRELRALPVTGTLTEADRVGTGGVYTLPDGLLEIRTLARVDEEGPPLEQVALSAIGRRSTSAIPLQFAIRGDTIEIRGVPGTDAEFDLEYLGHPAAFVDDTDENDLLTNHEALYLYAALFYCYQFTQDVELAQGALDTYTDTLEKLNEAVGRRLGGASIAPAYTFGCGGSY